MRGADLLLFPRGEEEEALRVAAAAARLLTKEQREQGFRWVVWEAMHWEEGEVLAVVLCEGTAPTQFCLAQGWDTEGA